ncbi:centromere protein O [Narcine bancroftii]|uniref:centromere protein O n=1 Tax=Narcine bancroftii TaxID=1343680 RepID=UPI0038310C24
MLVLVLWELYASYGGSPELCCLAAGILRWLEQLEQSVEQQAAEQEEAQQSREQLLQLQATLQRLRTHRDDLLLQSTVTAKTAGDMQEFVAQSQPQPSVPLCWEDIDNTVIKGNLESLHDILQAYHLTGISVQRRDPCSTFTFCISTAYDSIYLDSYYLDIKVQQPRKVIRHNIPAFIPVEQTACTHLQQDLAQFLNVLHKALNAYVSRRYQLEQLQKCHGRYLSQIQRNAACNLLKFQYSFWCEDMEQSVLVKLIYKDTESCLPTDVSFTCSGETPESVQQKLESHRQLFLHQHLHRALDSIQLQQEMGLSCDSPLQHNTQLPSTRQGD